MSVSAALQTMIYQRLTGFAALTAIVGARIYDKPTATAIAPYVSFGPSDYVPLDADLLTMRTETLQIDCWSEAGGKTECKTMADAIKSALHKYQGAIDPGALVSIEVTQVRVLDDPDGITTHGIVMVDAILEE